MNYKDITYTSVGVYISKKRTSLYKINRELKYNYDNFLNSMCIYIIHTGQDKMIIRVLNSKFFFKYYNHYINIYESKQYYVDYVVRGKRKLSEKRSKKRKVGKGYRKDIYKRDNYACVMCGNDYELTIDHIVPLKVDNNHSIYNLCTLCPICNNEKADKVIPNFINLYINKNKKNKLWKTKK